MNRQELWGVYFRYLRDKSKRGMINEMMEYEEGIAMASEVLLSISKDEVERARLMSEYKYVVDTQSKVVHAKREGRREGVEEVARRFKSMGISVEKIAQGTGLTGEQIKDL
jgi:predicted transposase/invertase (TIGR01784 family)